LLGGVMRKGAGPDAESVFGGPSGQTGDAAFPAVAVRPGMTLKAAPVSAATMGDLTNQERARRCRRRTSL